MTTVFYTSYTGLQFFRNDLLQTLNVLNVTYFNKINWKINDKSAGLLMFSRYMIKCYYTYILVYVHLYNSFINLPLNRTCKMGWRKFGMSCYFTSGSKKNWTESRKACIAEGSDLVIINTGDEQAFVNSLLNSGENAWIGLTDSLTEGEWKWVDGTPVTTAYWQPGQPNNKFVEQDCGEIVQNSPVGDWNDDGCFADQKWICEK
uniref:C-type lectin domain-containing protein n=2 Tax=Sphaeramia orbicularis TaxID=375764 RepID=A0A673A7D2_9TELE